MKKAVPVQQLVNWYYGNYCTRKCYNDNLRQEEHVPKLRELAKKMRVTLMTHQQFLTLLRLDKTICDLPEEEWKARKFSWKNDDCIVCRKLGVR